MFVIVFAWELEGHGFERIPVWIFECPRGHVHALKICHIQVRSPIRQSAIASENCRDSRGEGSFITGDSWCELCNELRMVEGELFVALQILSGRAQPERIEMDDYIFVRNIFAVVAQQTLHRRRMNPVQTQIGKCYASCDFIEMA